MCRASTAQRWTQISPHLGLQKQHEEGCCVRHKQEILTPASSNEGVSLLSWDEVGLFKNLFPRGLKTAPSHIASSLEQEQSWKAMTLQKTKPTSQCAGGTLLFKHFNS